MGFWGKATGELGRLAGGRGVARALARHESVHAESGARAARPRGLVRHARNPACDASLEGRARRLARRKRRANPGYFRFSGAQTSRARPSWASSRTARERGGEAAVSRVAGAPGQSAGPAGRSCATARERTRAAGAARTPPWSRRTPLGPLISTLREHSAPLTG